MWSWDPAQDPDITPPAEPMSRDPPVTLPPPCHATGVFKALVPALSQLLGQRISLPDSLVLLILFKPGGGPEAEWDHPPPPPWDAPWKLGGGRLFFSNKLTPIDSTGSIPPAFSDFRVDTQMAF